MTILHVSASEPIPVPRSGPDELYREAAARFGAALDRLARAWEADPDKRRDLLQDIHLNLWRSFGHFDATTNRDILRRLAKSIRKDGRIILDLWNPEFFKARQGARALKTARGTVREIKRVDGGRLFVELEYPDGAHEQFEWQLFTPEQMTKSANAVGLTLSVSCAGFDTTSFPSPSNPRIQFVLERAG